MNNTTRAANTLTRLKENNRKRENNRIGRVINSIISARITNRIKYINASPYMTREEKKNVRDKVRNENVTLQKIKELEKAMKAQKNAASSKFLKSVFTPRKNVKR